MRIDLSDQDIIFIYGHFKKELKKIDDIANAPNCPFDKTNIQNQKAPFLSVIEKLKTQAPNLSQMDKYF